MTLHFGFMAKRWHIGFMAKHWPTDQVPPAARIAARSFLPYWPRWYAGSS